MRPSENTLFTNPAPPVDALQAAALAGDLYARSFTVAALSGERDALFQARGNDGGDYLLRFINSGEEADLTQFQTDVFLHLCAVAPELPVQRIHPTAEGGPIGHVMLAGGYRSPVRLVDFLPGRPLVSTGWTPLLAPVLGRQLARLDKALASFPYIPQDRHLLWDMKHFPSLEPLIAQLADERDRSLSALALQRYLACVSPVAPSLRWQVIHNDLNPHNILIDSERPASVTGIIDFGDMAHAPLINDVATATAYLFGNASDAIEDICAFVAAYHDELPLEPRELAVLYHLITARQVMTLAITEWRANQRPENRAYITRNAPRARLALERLAAMSPAQFEDLVTSACFGAR